MFNKKVIIDSLRNLNKLTKVINKNSTDTNQKEDNNFINAAQGIDTPIYKAVKVGASPIEGKGLFADQAIRKGDVIGISHIRKKFMKNGEEYQAPFPSTVLGYYNHSEEPNVYEVDNGNYIMIVAGRDIQRGQELTSDYSKHNIEDLEVPEDFKRGGSTKRPKMPKGKSTRSYSRSLEATNRFFAEHAFFAKPKSRKNKIYDPNAKYYQDGGNINNYAPGGELSPKDLDPATLEKYLSDLRGLENSIKKGYKNNKWYPHASVEGGAKTIAYGHKLQPGESFASGLTEQEARDLQKKDVLAHQTKAEKYVDDKYGTGTYDKLPQNSQMMLTDYAYNLGSLNKFPSFVEGVVKGDKNKMLQEYERRGLTQRNNWTKDVINTTDFSKGSDEGFNWFNWFNFDWWNKKNGGLIKANGDSTEKKLDGKYGGQLELGDIVNLTLEQVAELKKYGYTLEQVSHGKI